MDPLFTFLALSFLNRVRLILIIAAAAAALLWLLVVLVLRVIRQPRTPEAAPPTNDLGPAPPALANFLTQDFKVRDEAVAATLLDLAARKLLDIEQAAPGLYMCRVRPVAPVGLMPYEQQVLGLVQSKAVGGVVPLDAISFASATEARRWRKRFRNAVIDDAQQHSLSEDLWGGGALAVLTTVGAIPGLLLGLAFLDEIEVAFGVSITLSALAYGALKAGRRQRHTPAGLAAASAWLGVRDGLAQNEMLDTYPPTAVVVWERHLAYAAALGVAGTAAEALPVGPEHDRRAWSSYGGRWRRVGVRYPRLVPGWGRPPWFAVLFGLALALPAAILVFVASQLAQVTPDPTGGILSVVVVALIVLAILFGLAVLALVIGGIADSFSEREVTGLVVRSRRTGGSDRPVYWIAVDDGTSDRIRAWRVGPGIYTMAPQGTTVRARVTGTLAHVKSVEPVLDVSRTGTIVAG